jgi:hypothetical protein
LECGTDDFGQNVFHCHRGFHARGSLRACGARP